MSTAKRKGTAWETAIVTHLQAHGATHAERRALAGANDKGDVTGIPGVVIEAKSAARLELGVWLAEAHAERANAGAALGVVWAKRRGKAQPADGYVVMDGATFTHLLQAAGYIPTRTQESPR